MKKLLTILLAAVTIAALLIVGCKNDENASLEKTNDFYGMGAVTAVKLLNSEFSAQAIGGLASVGKLRAKKTVNDSLDIDTVKENAKTFHQYLGMLDGFLGDEVVKTELSKNSDEKYAEYENKLVIIGKDVHGNSVTHVMYYSETLQRVEEETDDDDFEIEVEVEKEYRLTGVLVLDGVDYPMTGERNEETDGDEREDEIKIRAYMNENDKSTYVQVKQETEVETGEMEEKYVYTVVVDGKVVEETAVEFETEKKLLKDEIKYEVEFLSGDGAGKYSIKKIADGDKVMLKVEYRLNGKGGEFIVREVLNDLGAKAYEYRFEDGSSLILDAAPAADVEPAA